MAIQSLQDFQTTFRMDPVEVEIVLGKEASFSILLKPLSSAARDAFETSIAYAVKDKGEKGKAALATLRSSLVHKCWVGADGKPIGTLAQIGEQRADVIAAIFEKVRELNGMDKDVAKVEEEKND
jgi:hypothetical protein